MIFQLNYQGSGLLFCRGGNVKRLFFIVSLLLITTCLVWSAAALANSFSSYTEDITALLDSPTIITINGYGYGSYPSITESGATVDRIPTSLDVAVTNQYISSDSQYKYIDTHYLGYGEQSFTISFNQPVSQVGMGFYDLNYGGNTLIAYGAGDVELERISDLPYPGMAVTSVFAGFQRSTADIVSIDYLCAPGDAVGIDNVSFSRFTNVAPLPNAAWLLGSGLLGLLGWKRFKNI